ncbi:MAG: flagellin [Pseudomonadota bacterium]
MTSIHNNAGAMVALSTLSMINNEMLDTQSAIATGKTVNSAADDAAIWAVTTVMQADVDGFNAISESLSLGKATVTVARNAAEQVTELLTDMKEKIVTAQGENVDREKIQTDIDELKSQIDSIVNAAQFNGLNLLNGSEDTVDVLASLDRGPNGVESNSITVTAQNLSGGNDKAGSTVGAFIQGDVATSRTRNEAAFSAPAGTDFAIAGGGAASTGTSDIEITIEDSEGNVTSLGSVTVDDRASASDRALVIADYINSRNDDRIRASIDAGAGGTVEIFNNGGFEDLEVTLRATTGDTTIGGAASSKQTVSAGLDTIDLASNDINTGALTLNYAGGGVLNFSLTDSTGEVVSANFTAATDLATTARGLADAIQTALGSATADVFKDVNVYVDNTNVIQIDYRGSEDLTVNTFASGTTADTIAFDSGATTTDGDIAAAGGTGTLWANAADVRIAKDAGGGGLVEGDSYRLSIQKDLNGDGDTAETEFVNFDYVVKQGDDQNDVMEGLEALVKADSRFDDVYIEAINNGDTSNATGDNTYLRVDSRNGDMTISFSGFRGGEAGGGLGKLAGIDVRSTQSAAQALQDIEELIQTSIDAAAAFGSTEGRLDAQSNFVSSLIDSMESGIGALVDTDMEAASARLQSLQVQQQLATQALSIANSAPQNILALFR